MKYRKKPVIVEAHQWTEGTDAIDNPPWVVEAILIGRIRPVVTDEDLHLFIKTLEGTMRANVGDWIICGVKGEIYPCNNEIFKMTYELVENGK